MHLQRLLQLTVLLTSYNCWSKARLHHRSCDHVFARRAALLSGICLAAIALVGADVALAQEGPLIYVPNLNGNDVTVIDTSTNTVLPVTIPVGSVALAAAVRGDQSLVYVSNGGDNTVSVIDTPTNSVIATIPVGILPTLIALSPDNRRAYVANQGSNDVTVIDTVTNTVVATIPVGTQATGVAVTPDGTSVYATNTASSTVSVIDTATNTVGATISVGTAPQGVTVTPDGTRVYVTNGISNDVTVIATATNTVVATIPAGVNPAVVTITPDGTRAYVANQGSDNVTVIDTATNTVVTTIPVGTQATGVVINRDGTLAYVTNTGSNTVSVINTATNTIVATLPVGISPLVAGICSNGNALLGTGLSFRANTGGALACTRASGPGGAGPVFTGGTLLIAGASVSSSLPILLQSQGGIVDTNGNIAALSGAISGPGGLSKIGMGTLTLSGQSTYTGATAIDVGTLQAGAVNTFSPSSAFSVASNAVLNLASFNQTIGSLAGAGAVTLGAATLTTGNDNTSTTFSGVISGSGGLTKIGNGILTLNGANAFTGATTLNAGGLVVTGSLVSSVTVNSGVLSGNGTLGGLSLAGTLAPGNSIGTLTVAGNAAFNPGSTYEVEINAPGESDRLAATGIVTLDGGQVIVLSAPGNYAIGTAYTIITAGGGLTGSFASVTDSLPLLDAMLTYLPNSVLLTLEKNAVTLASLGLTPNQRSTGAGIDSLGGGALADALSALGDADIPNALNLLSGEIHASIKNAFIEESRYLREAAMDRLRAAFGSVGAEPLPVLGYDRSGPMAAEADAPLAAWGAALGAWGSFDLDGNASELDRSTGGFLTGIDALVSDNARLGLLGGYSYSSFDVDGRFSSGRANSVHLGAYGGLQRNNLGLRGGAAYSWHFIDTSRTATFGNFSETLDADYHAGTAQVFGEAGYRIDTNTAAFEPFANLAYVNFRTNGFNETGGVAALSHPSDNTDQTFTTLGVRVSMPLSFGDSEAKLSGMIGWRHAFNDVTPQSGFAFAGGSPFLISGIPIAEDALALETGIDIKLDEKFSLGVGYSGQIGNDTQDHSANARLTISF